MEDLDQYLRLLQRADALTQKLMDTLEDDKMNIHRAMIGEAETLYKQQCDRAVDEIKKIQNKIRILYSESSAGL